MKTGRAGRILCAGLVVLGGTAAVLWACGETGSIHGTVTESLHGHALPGACLGLERTADLTWVASTGTDEHGEYEFTGLTPDAYTLMAGHMYHQPKTASVAVTAGSDATKDFVLDPIPANIEADVVSLDQISNGKTGGWRTVQVKVTYQTTCHLPLRLVVWAWCSSPAKAYVIFDSGETNSWWCYSSYLDTTVSPNRTSSGYDTVETLRFAWNTIYIPNGPYTLKAALKCSDPHGDGTDENPDPAAESWAHWAGSPPTTTADGTAGGATLNAEVVNVVITNYGAKDTPLPNHPEDAFLYDPDAASPLCNPSFDVTIDNWITEPMEIWVWVAATAWADTRPVPDCDPYVSLDVNTAGTYTLTWDGSNPGYPYWEGEWGTWSFDADIYRMDSSGTYATDHFFAKTHDGRSDNYDVLIDPVNHHVWWCCDETTTPPGYQFRCNYIVHSDESTPPSAVELVTLKELTVETQNTKTGTWTYLNTLHDNITTYPGSGYTTEDDTLGTWRTVFTGQTASGAEHRRDGTNPRILATNQRSRRLVNIAFADLPEEEDVTTQANEITPGGFIGVNDDDDDGEAGVIDKDRAYNPATPVPLATDDPDLLPVKVVASRDRVVDRYVELVVPPELNVWPDRKKNEFTGTAVPVVRNGNHVASVIWMVPKLPTGNGFLTITLYMEGMASGTAQLTAKIKAAADATVPLQSDMVNVTVLRVELLQPAADQEFYMGMSPPSMPTVELKALLTPPRAGVEYRFEVGDPANGRALEYEDAPTGYAHPAVVDSGWLGSDTWGIQFGASLYGGHVMKVKVSVRKDGQLLCSSLIDRQCYILGDAITAANREAYINSLGTYGVNVRTIARVVALQESGGTHFWSGGGVGAASHTRYPMKQFVGPGGGYGLMQLTDTALLNVATIWDWQSNIDAAMARLEDCCVAGDGHLNAHPAGVTNEMKRLEAYNRYNGGLANRYHWWDGAQWVKFGYIVCPGGAGHAGHGATHGYRDYNNDGVADPADNPYGIPAGPSGPNECTARAARYADHCLSLE